MDTSFKGIPPAPLLFAACAFWGVATVINKLLLNSIPPIALLFTQLLASAALLWPACMMLRKPMPRGAALTAAIALGILNPGISYTFSMLGLERISASVSSLLWSCEPFLILALAWLILREPMRTKVVAVIAVGFAGVFLVSGLLSASSASQSDAAGIGFTFLAVLMCAF